MKLRKKYSHVVRLAKERKKSDVSSKNMQGNVVSEELILRDGNDNLNIFGRL